MTRGVLSHYAITFRVPPQRVSDLIEWTPAPKTSESKGMVRGVKNVVNSSDVLCINGIDVVKLVNQLVSDSFELVRRVGNVCRGESASHFMKCVGAFSVTCVLGSNVGVRWSDLIKCDACDWNVCELKEGNASSH